jgi:hypothetical protein
MTDWLKTLTKRGVHKGLWFGRAELQRWKDSLDASNLTDDDIR